ncbi:MAG TPA: NUDIX domain-containing protein [Bacteroidales bacterium]|nr:NUDIX domain-containing protein [Bacteroidales bacterium]
MYKVYFENRFMVLSSQPDRMQKYCLFYKFHDQMELYDKISEFINNRNLKCANFYSYKANHLWKAFESYFNWVEAAGGVVIHDTDQILFIKRYGKWDIPKGHIKKDEKPDECALREIGEECGITGSTITGQLRPTYHIYPYGNKYYLKKTFWFLLDYKGPYETSPQLSEGITEATWLPYGKLPGIMNETWASVSDVLNEVSLKLFKK